MRCALILLATGCIPSFGNDECFSVADCPTPSWECVDNLCKPPAVPDAGDAAAIDDAGPPDSGAFDSGRPDTGRPDTGIADTGVADTGVADSGVGDAGDPDAGDMDAGAPDSGVVTCNASPAWSQIIPSIPARARAAAAYDSARDVVVLFGGLNGGLLGDTWELAGSPPHTWIQVMSAQQPPARSEAAMAYDPLRQKIVLHGGLAGSQYLSDTWEYDAAGWSPNGSGPARARAAMEYDPGARAILLFGGHDGVMLQGTAHLYDGAWSNGPVPSPPAREAHRMAYDPGGARIVLAAGFMAGMLPDTTTWVFDGTWMQLAGASPTNPGASIAYHEGLQSIVWFDGSAMMMMGGAETWRLSGSTWSNANIAKPPSRRGAHVLVRTRCGVVLMGGDMGGTTLSDTWILE